MADSWEDIDKPKKSSGLNPAATSFTFNPSVPSWTPSNFVPVPAPGDYSLALSLLCSTRQIARHNRELTAPALLSAQYSDLYRNRNPKPETD